MRKSIFTAVAAAAVVGGLMTATSAHAASDYFLEVTSNTPANAVNGDQTVGKITNAVQINDFSMSVENITTIGSATSGAGAGKVKFNELTITKPVDATSPMFFKLLASGQMIPGMELIARKAGANGNYIYQRYYFKMVAVTKQEQSPSDDGINETLTFAYGALGETYVKQNTTTGTTTNVFQSWSQVNNVGQLIIGTDVTSNPYLF
jgi:type VI secretion system secreted protein Hcp